MNLSKTTSPFSLANIWFVLLILSYSYDRPIFLLSSVDRFNPRLYDVATFIGFIWLLTKGSYTKTLNPIYQSYLKIVLWFVTCTIMGVIFYDFPIKINGFSVFFAAKYLQEVFLCFIVIKYLHHHKINYDKLFKLIIFGGVFVSIYCVFELQTIGSRLIELTSDVLVNKTKGYIWGPFRMSYFQLGNYSPIVGFITLCYSMTKKGAVKYIYMFISMFIFYPAFICGSRASIGLVLIIFFISSLIEVKFKYWFLGFLLFTLLFIAFFPERISFFIENSENITLARMNNIEENSNDSFFGRFNHMFLWFDKFKEYIYSGYFVPIFGGGFYVAPMNGIYRIGYGWHNIYLFAIEQSGVIGLILFFKFIKKVLVSLRNKRIQLKKYTIEYWFVLAVRVIFISILVIGIFGSHSFWNGFSTGNLNSFRLILIIIATHSLIKRKHEESIIN